MNSQIHCLFFADRSINHCADLNGSSQIDSSLDGNEVGGLEERSLQEQGEEQEHREDVSIGEELLGGDEIHSKMLHLQHTKPISLTRLDNPLYI